MFNKVIENVSSGWISLAISTALLPIGTIAAMPVCRAQSVDIKHPTPLGPGINKGNITNDVAFHIYSFTAGPGHIDVDMAFKEMGLFGNPYRQFLNFDFYTEDGKLSSHNTVVSQGGIAHGHTDGDLASAQKFILAVSTQKAVIKVGGYYEIKITGAVNFTGGPAGADVKPQDSEPLVKSGVPLTR